MCKGNEDNREVQGFVSDAASYGSCLGCSAKAVKVAVIRLRNVEVRVCRECWKELRNYLSDFR